MSNMKKPKTFDEALKSTGRPDVPQFNDVPEDLREYFQNQYKAIVVAESLNEGEERVNYRDPDQEKWYPWFEVSPSGVVFDACYCEYTNPSAGRTSRLGFKTKADARHAGENFPDIYEGIILK